MATEVSALVRLLTRHDKEGSGSGGVESKHGGDLVTRDLLGGCWAAPPAGERKEHDVRVKDLSMPVSCSPGFPPPSRPAAPQLNGLLQEQPAAVLGLGLRPSAPPPPAEYQSVCTLEKVRSALERAQRESSQRKPPPPPPAPASPSSSSTTTSSAKRLRAAGPDEEGEREAKSSPSSSSTSASSVVVQGAGEEGSTGMAAAGCPTCLLYVLISRSDPRCPRCSSAVPLPPPPGKRPRIDLNAAVATEPAAASDPIRTLHFF